MRKVNKFLCLNSFVFKNYHLTFQNDYEMDDKAINLANSLNKAVKDSHNLRDNLKPLFKIIKKISLCIAHKPVR